MLMAVGEFAESRPRRNRRTKAEMLRLRVAIHNLDLDGKSRKAIALITGATNAQVTRILGAKRAYKSYRQK